MPSSDQISGMRWVRRCCGIGTGVTLAFLYLPILLLVVYSFNRGNGNAWQGFTTQWYHELLHDPELIPALKSSLILATAVTLVSVTLGVMGAWLSYRHRFGFAKAVLSMIYIPILMPDVIMGTSLLVLFASIFKLLHDHLSGWHWAQGLQLGFGTLLLSHVTFCFPFVMVGVQARLNGMDPSLEEAALDLGATPMQAFLKVVLPYLMPSVVAGALMAFTLSMDELIVTTFTTGSEWQTLPIVVFGLARKGLSPTLNALSAAFIVATAVLMGIGEYLRRPGQNVS